MKVILVFMLLCIGCMSFASISTAHSPVNYPLVCVLQSNIKGPKLKIETYLDGVFGAEGSKRVTVRVNDNEEVGFISTEDGQDENGHGLKYIQVYFGEHLVLNATLSPYFSNDDDEKIIGKGGGTVYRFNREYVGHGNCELRSLCELDSRVCPD